MNNQTIWNNTEVFAEVSDLAFYEIDPWDVENTFIEFEPESDDETILYATDDFEMSELEGEYSGTPNRFTIFCKKTDAYRYTSHGHLYTGNYQAVKETINQLQLIEAFNRGF